MTDGKLQWAALFQDRILLVLDRPPARPFLLSETEIRTALAVDLSQVVLRKITAVKDGKIVGFELVTFIPGHLWQTACTAQEMWLLTRPPSAFDTNEYDCEVVCSTALEVSQRRAAPLAQPASVDMRCSDRRQPIGCPSVMCFWSNHRRLRRARRRTAHRPGLKSWLVLRLLQFPTHGCCRSLPFCESTSVS
jgi:hypothetical protein